MTTNPAGRESSNLMRANTAIGLPMLDNIPPVPGGPHGRMAPIAGLSMAGLSGNLYSVAIGPRWE
ncbi:MAG: hypothetical protein ABSH24_05775 [Bryobacteraceae bacterium]|jgi:hypothetical protein